MLEIKNLNFRYKSLKKNTLNNINLSLKRGERLLILGPSGSGKSTLGYLINDLARYSYKAIISGEVKRDGREQEDLHEVSLIVGTIMQDTDSQFVGLSVAEDIAFALENQLEPVKDMHEKVEKTARLVEMQDYLKQSPIQLSGGQKQRVSLAGILVNDVKLLLFDEPLANLDPRASFMSMKLIDKIARDQNQSVVIIEHRIEEVLACKIDKVIIINNNEIIKEDTVENILYSNILKEVGIREPLYLRALRLAGIKISKEVCNDIKYAINYKKEIDAWIEGTEDNDKAEAKEDILNIKNLSYSYNAQRKALDDINFSIKEGQIVSILGKNGSGKSTLANIIMGFLKEDEGEILFKNKNLSDLSSAERSEFIAYVMQNPNHMISHSKVYDEVSFALRLKDLDKKVIDEKVDEVLKVCGLYEKRNWPISALSYGQKKRVTIASVLVMNPKILILDEPTSAQDYYHYTSIMSFILDIHKKYNMSILCITHDMHLSLEYTQRALVFCDSKLIYDGPSYDVHSNKEILEQGHLHQSSLFDLAQVLSYDKEKAQKLIKTFIKSEKLDER